MRFPALEAVLVTLATLPIFSVPLAAQTRSCPASLEPDARADCLVERLAEDATDPTAFADLTSIVESAPSTARGILDRVVARYDAASAADRASALDLSGQVLLLLGDSEGAVRAYDEALALSDGTPRLNWLSAADGPVWSATVDAGAGRLGRAARAYAKAGRDERARSLLERSHALGASDWSDDPVFESLPPGPWKLDPTPLVGRPWFMPAPDYALNQFDGGERKLAESRGRVLILNFWATWCAPCQIELPYLQQLYDEQQGAGLEVVAINAGEPAAVAVSWAREIGLTLPLASYDSGMNDVFEVKALPTTIVIDRGGRIRTRWDGYKDGLEREIGALAEQLLEEGAEPPLRTLGTVVSGGERFDVAWVRDTPAHIDGLVALPSGGDAVVAASHGKRLGLYRADGRSAGSFDSSTAAGRLRVGPVDEDGGYRLVGYREGATKVVAFDMPNGEFVSWDLESPIFDLVSLDSDRLVVGALDGLHSGSGDKLSRVDGFGGVGSLRAVGGPEGWRLLALDAREQRLAWLDRNLAVSANLEIPDDAWTLVADASRPDQAGVAPLSVHAAVTGGFLGADRRQIALATRSGQLVILDLDSGAELYRARWSGIRDLAVVDLEGDGRDELFVAAGRRLAQFTGRPGKLE